VVGSEKKKIGLWWLQRTKVQDGGGQRFANTSVMSREWTWGGVKKDSQCGHRCGEEVWNVPWVGGQKQRGGEEMGGVSPIGGRNRGGGGVTKSWEILGGCRGGVKRGEYQV